MLIQELLHGINPVLGVGFPGFPGFFHIVIGIGLDVFEFLLIHLLGAFEQFVGSVVFPLESGRFLNEFLAFAVAKNHSDERAHEEGYYADNDACDIHLMMFCLILG